MKTEAALEAALCQASPRLIEDLKKIDGDILILGIGGKMGPSLARLARKAITEAGLSKQVIGVSRFSNKQQRAALEADGIQTIAGDLLDETFLQKLPAVDNVIFMAGQKFGTTGNQAYTWAMNTYLPGRVAEQFRNSRLVVFSTGNVYPFTPTGSRGATETIPPAPVGEYAQSCLGRERIFHYFSDKYGTPMLFYRLNYALDLRYGVLNDIARKVWAGAAVDLRMSHVNVIWQGDANEYALRALLHCQHPPKLLNVTGPETLSVQWLAVEFGKRMQRTPHFSGEPQPTALLSNAATMEALFGPPRIGIQQMIDWTVEWIRHDGKEINKPTHFQARDGAF